MIEYVPLPRRCSDCGKTDTTILIETSLGDRFCATCWRDTTRDSGAHQPATRRLDQLIEQEMRR